MQYQAGFRKILIGSVCALGLVATSETSAQVATYYDNNVMVDLSVLDDGGRGAAPKGRSQMVTPGAKLPPLSMPKSQFFGLPASAPTQSATATPGLNLPQAKPQSRIVLKKPSLSAPKTAMAPAPALKKPSAPKISAPAPKMTVADKAPKSMVKKAVTPKPALPAAVVAEKKAVPPAPAPAPVKTVEVKQAPDTKPVATIDLPKPIVKKEATPPAVVADAPPPPPPSVVEPKKVASALKQQAPQTKPTSTAALPPASEGAVRITFDEGQSEMPSAAQANLESLIKELSARPNDRVQLLGYAGGEDMSANKARRLSLSRALAVRSYLTKTGGIRSTRIDVRALGNKTTEEPFDRVDVQITSR